MFHANHPCYEKKCHKTTSVPKVTLTLVGLLLIYRRNYCIINFPHCFYTLACYQIMRIKKIINLGFNYCLDLTPYSQDCSKENYTTSCLENLAFRDWEWKDWQPSPNLEVHSSGTTPGNLCCWVNSAYLPSQFHCRKTICTICHNKAMPLTFLSNFSALNWKCTSSFPPETSSATT